LVLTGKSRLVSRPKLLRCGMTKAYSMIGDNGGLCEFCLRPETEYQAQTTYPVMLGAGFGMGTMWLCPKCLLEHKLRDMEGKSTTAFGGL